ncbi:hypothetical protein [Streptomyces griseus]|uniref:hypothetical protein n=1 Tax=Streptomyces griseus TaxID=1911 RepID=UPI000A37CE27|nr:hypothetical protein [Streptomyces fimicarius]
MITTLVTRDRTTGLRRGPIRWPDGTPPPPFGCRRCGHDQQVHGGAGHRWERPTGAQIFARMTARRRTRVQAAAEGLRLDPGYQWIAHTATSTPPARCDAMNHDSVGNERFCQLDEGHGPDEDHDAGDMTWPCED